MRTKDSTVETQFHPILTAFLFEANELYRKWRAEVVITSGSEDTLIHSLTSLHYATPAQAADIRIWEVAGVPESGKQAALLQRVATKFCKSLDIPKSWIEIILESDHIHIEYQPKRKEL